MGKGEKDYVYIWDRILIFVTTRGYVSETHGHYASSLLISLDEPFRLWPEGDEEKSFQAILLPPNYRHGMQAPADSRMLVFQLDPDAFEFRALRNMVENGEPGLPDIGALDELRPALDSLFRGEPDCAGALRIFKDVLAVVGGPGNTGPRPSRMDGRIASVLARLQAEEELPESLPVGELAASVELSPDRFMHLFKEHMGLPVRRYLLWLRLRRAAQRMKEGITLTQAAHAAGFADSAHMSRTFKDMFGMKPSAIMANAKLVELRFCEGG